LTANGPTNTVNAIAKDPAHATENKGKNKQKILFKKQ
jgi:hypothetical protein